MCVCVFLRLDTFVVFASSLISEIPSAFLSLVWCDARASRRELTSKSDLRFTSGPPHYQHSFAYIVSSGALQNPMEELESHWKYLHMPKLNPPTLFQIGLSRQSCFKYGVLQFPYIHPNSRLIFVFSSCGAFVPIEIKENFGQPCDLIATLNH